MIHIPLEPNIAKAKEISLCFEETDVRASIYPASRIQKGPVLACNNVDLSEEGVGFGVPVLKFGHETIFPGHCSLTTGKEADFTILSVDYCMDLAERMAVRGRKIDAGSFYRIKEYFSLLHRVYPHLRGILTRASIASRRAFDIKTLFEKVEPIGVVNVVYVIRANEGKVHVRLDTKRVKKEGCTGIIIMNEQGANHFDAYRDSTGLFLLQDEIGTWDETFADGASFIDPCDGVSFTLSKINGSRMFRGRELVTDRLAWSGLAYSLPGSSVNFAYDIKIGVCT
ncbi:MAG TPA: hypothetical protein VIO58_09075 [Candidatus Methanoperedens sp.]